MEPVSDSSEISEAEVEAPTVIISKSFWDVADAYHSGSNSSSENKGIDTKEKSKQPVKTANYNLMAAVFFLVLSILLGLLLTVKRP